MNLRIPRRSPDTVHIRTRSGIVLWAYLDVLVEDSTYCWARNNWKFRRRRWLDTSHKSLGLYCWTDCECSDHTNDWTCWFGGKLLWIFAGFRWIEKVSLERCAAVMWRHRNLLFQNLKWHVRCISVGKERFLGLNFNFQSVVAHQLTDMTGNDCSNEKFPGMDRHKFRELSTQLAKEFRMIPQVHCDHWSGLQINRFRNHKRSEQPNECVTKTYPKKSSLLVFSKLVTNFKTFPYAKSFSSTVNNNSFQAVNGVVSCECWIFSITSSMPHNIVLKARCVIPTSDHKCFLYPSHSNRWIFVWSLRHDRPQYEARLQVLQGYGTMFVAAQFWQCNSIGFCSSL